MNLKVFCRRIIRRRTVQDRLIRNLFSKIVFPYFSTNYFLKFDTFMEYFYPFLKLQNSDSNLFSRI